MRNTNPKMPTKMSLFILALCISSISMAQQFTISNSSSTLTIEGTSSLHDWEEVAEIFKGSIRIDKDTEFFIKKLDVTIQAESLKSGKRAMDKNTYKALKTDTYKTISYTLTSVKNLIDNGNGNYTAEVSGNLTIAGVKKGISMNLTLAFINNGLSIKGEKKIKMTDYNIEPPKALLGTITTGDEITVNFNLKSSNL
ncbi:YceI family protein [Cellulophaga sp. F20128]|uniref:YceI family protein n=1 Tax=Cellulophaga sp. F20128 TaxID=2926413 RepID=UPI001FF2F2D4|nr:YceI family protein [Cellulophaga sp. F20128]MCK0156952.1 YceI family protein [Cellulophaga sp. F20128]